MTKLKKSAAPGTVPGAALDSRAAANRPLGSDVRSQMREFDGEMSATKQTLDQLRAYLDGMRRRLAQLN